MNTLTESVDFIKESHTVTLEDHNNGLFVTTGVGDVVVLDFKVVTSVKKELVTNTAASETVEEDTVEEVLEVEVVSESAEVPTNVEVETVSVESDGQVVSE